MSITREELARRLRSAREAAGLTQEDVGRRLEVSRPTVAQMELGNREVTSLELDRLAGIYGREMADFLVQEIHDPDPLSALFRAHPEVLRLPAVAEALSGCLRLGREITRLERLLGVDREGEIAAVYPLSSPRARWQAVQQGEQVAGHERRRLGLESAALGVLADLLESQGVRTAVVDLPEDVSGLTLWQAEVGAFVVVNRRHPPVRRRFSLAHEYAHVLLDRQNACTVSRAADRDELIEVRANAFAASFLLPGEGVRLFLSRIGKGAPSRQRADVFDEAGVIEASVRSVPKSQDLQLYEVAELAEHFGVSRLAALYRLRNLRHLSDSELEALKTQEESGKGRAVAALLKLPEIDDRSARDEFRHRFLGMALEAFRRDEISQAKLAELAELVGLAPHELVALLQETGLVGSEDDADVLLPAE